MSWRMSDSRCQSAVGRLTPAPLALAILPITLTFRFPFCNQTGNKRRWICIFVFCLQQIPNFVALG
jgi:hypothetical protein